MDRIREDYKANGALHKKLLNIADGKLLKLNAAGKPASHAEVQVLDYVIESLRRKGIPITEDVIKQTTIYIKNQKDGNMCRCPNCFYIIGDMVKIIGNE